MTIRWLSDDNPMIIQWLSRTFDLFFLMIIDLKRSIDRRWLFKSGAIFILRWSCFMLRKKATFLSNNKRNVCLIWNENRQKLDVFRHYPLSIMRKVYNLSLRSGVFSSYPKTNWREKKLILNLNPSESEGQLGQVGVWASFLAFCQNVANDFFNEPNTDKRCVFFCV